MPKHINKVADSGAEDVIRALNNVCCNEAHSLTLYNKYSSQLENGTVDVDNPEIVNELLERADNAKKQMDSFTNLRRAIMQKLMEMSDGNKDQWCCVKHSALTANCLYEAWMASSDDADLERLYLDAQAEYTKVLSDFMGFEITPCSACFSDMLKEGETDG